MHGKLFYQKMSEWCGKLYKDSQNERTCFASLYLIGNFTNNLFINGGEIHQQICQQKPK